MTLGFPIIPAKLSPPRYLPIGFCAIVLALSLYAPVTAAQEKKTGSGETKTQQTTEGGSKASATTTKSGGQDKSGDRSAKPAASEKPEDPKATADKQEKKSVTLPTPKPAVPIDLLAGDFAKSWIWFGAEEGVKLNDVWNLGVTGDQRVLVCKGTPKGYLRTAKPYGDYLFGFEFRFPKDENGNSGVLLHIAGKDKIWPDSIQLQLHREDAGSIFPMGSRKTPFTIGAQL